MRFADALSTERDPTRAVEQVCGEVSRSLSGEHPDLGFLFFHPCYADEAEDLSRAVREKTGVRVLLGCTAESVIGGGLELEREPGVSLWTASLPGVTLSPFRVSGEQTPDGYCFPLTPPEVFESAPPEAVAILLGEPFSFPVDMYLRRFNDDHEGVPVVGGMASGGMAPGDNVLVTGDEAVREGGVGVLVSGAVRVRTLVSQGCRPVGETAVVTDCDRNAILKLGGRPALQLVQEIYGSLPAGDRQLFQRAPHVGVVINERQESFGPGDFLIRNVIGVDPAGGAVFIADVLRRGQTIQLHVRDGGAASADLEAILGQVNGGLPDHPRGALLFTCNGRGTRLFPRPNHDVSALVRAWGPIPVGGFFAAGELGPVAGVNYLHGFTACVALFGA